MSLRWSVGLVVFGALFLAMPVSAQEPPKEPVVPPVSEPVAPPEAAPAVVEPAPVVVTPQPYPIVLPDGWRILIRPEGYDPFNEWAYSFTGGDPSWTPCRGPSVPCGARMSYECAYNSITYRWSEYRANPSYRHEAAMELMFGELRPTTVVRPAVQYGPREPYRVPVLLTPQWFQPPYSLYAY